MSFIDEILPENELQSIHFEPWGKDIYFYPMTVNDSDWVEKKAKGSQAKTVCYTLVRKCMDEDGNRVFVPADAATLSNKFNLQVLSQLVIQMYGDEDPSAEDLEKN